MKTLLPAAAAAVCGLAGAVSAQGPLMQPGFVAGGPAAVQDVTQAVHQRSPAANPFVNAHGEPFVAPAQYCDPMAGGYGPAGGAAGDPFGGAFMTTEQCGPHYFDFSAEYLRYWRDDSAVSDIPITTIGFANDDLAGLAEQTRLSGGDVDSDTLDGFRLTGRLDVGALSVVEFVYSGMYEDDDASFTVTDGSSTARLFSVFSRYGTATNGPVGGGDSAGPPTGSDFEETDFATTHEITYDSELQTAEALFRRYWVGFNPRVSGTILLGFRYTSLSETFGFNSIGSQQTGTNPDTFGPDPNLAISIAADADNRLAGFEFGGDAWITVFQGFRVGSEAKVGIYNNDYELSTSVSAVDGSPSSVTTTSGNQVAFLTEARVTAVADLTPNWSLRGGYELLYISDLALMQDGLAQAMPYGPINGLDAEAGGAGMTTNGDVLFHGFHAGLEYVW